MIDINKYISLLESFKKRKGMYVGSEDLESVSNFLSGFTVAAISHFPKLDYPNNLLHEIGSRRGWKRSPCGPIHYIEESDLSEEDKMNEVIDIYIECYEVMFKDHGVTDA
jgi:hypothetical protein